MFINFTEMSFFMKAELLRNTAFCPSESNWSVDFKAREKAPAFQDRSTVLF